jgi:hypothetical protein
MRLSISIAEDPTTRSWAMFDAVQMPSKSRDANRWKKYLRELEDLPKCAADDRGLRFIRWRGDPERPGRRDHGAQPRSR